MELPEQQECSVSGALGFVLRMAKFYGVAFCDFNSTVEGLRISVSRCASYYGKFIILLCIALSTVTLVLDYRLDKKLSLHSQSFADITVNVGSMLLISVVLLVEVYSGAKRMKETITCLAKIEKIEEDLNKYGPLKSFVKIKRNLALWSLFCGHAVVILDATILIFEIIDKDSNIVLASMYIAYYVEALMLKVLILQITLIFTTVLSGFYHLNNCLKLLQQQVNKELLGSNLMTIKPKKQNVKNIPNKLINNAIDSMVNEDTNDHISNTSTSTIRSLGMLYHSLCEVVVKMNDNYGVFFVSLMLYFLLHLITTPYLLLSRISLVNTDFYRALIQFLWAAYHISDIMMIVEPCHRTHEQINETKQLISQLLRSTPPEFNFNFFLELELFYKLLVANDVVYTPINMFTLDRTVVTTIFGSIATYLVVIVQGV